MKFDLATSKIYKAVTLFKIFPHVVIKTWRILLLAAGIIAIISYTITLYFGGFHIGIIALSSRQWQALSLILLPLGFSVLFFEIFSDIYLKNPRTKVDEENIAEFLDFDSAKLLDRAFKINNFISAILNSDLCKNIFYRLGINPDELKNYLENDIDIIALVGAANNNRVEHGAVRISVIDLVISLYETFPPFKQLIIGRDLDEKDLDRVAQWYESEAAFGEKVKRFWDRDNLLRRKPIGVSWVYASAPLLEHFARPLGGNLEGKDIENYFFGRQDTIDQIEKALLKASEANVILVGEPGVGKRTIIDGLAYLVKEGRVLPELKYKRVLELNLASIVSYAKDKTKVHNLLVEILDQAVKAGDVILFIDNFHNFLGEDGMGASDISRVILPYLESSRVQIIAAMDSVNFHKHLESRADLAKTFEKIIVSEPDLGSVIRIVEEIIPTIEYRFKLLFTYPAIKAIVENSDRYIQTVPFPEKAINLLNDVVSFIKSKKKSWVSKQDVDEVCSLKTNIPLGRINVDEKQKLLSLKEEMHKEIIGQDEAVNAVVETMQRLRAGLKARGKPAGVFLFIGPTGVGKTQTSKALARIYFGSPDKMIRFDMSEYQNLESVSRFLGSVESNEPGQLPSRVRDNPFSVLLFDEIEKANRNILNLFLQVFDEGRITDALGRKVSFEQNVIIATSNAGAQQIREMVASGVDPALQKEKVIDILISNQYFSPELLNRFDQIVVFHPLSQDEASTVAGLLVDKLVSRLKDQGYFFNPTPEILSYVAREGFDPKFGARPMQRVITDKIETVIAQKILEGEIKKGQEFSISIN